MARHAAAGLARPTVYAGAAIGLTGGRPSSHPRPSHWGRWRSRGPTRPGGRQLGGAALGGAPPGEVAGRADRHLDEQREDPVDQDGRHDRRTRSTRHDEPGSQRELDDPEASRRHRQRRDEARQGGCERAFDFPGFVPAYIRPLFCEGKGPFRWVALSGDPADIHRTDEVILKEFADSYLQMSSAYGNILSKNPGAAGALLVVRGFARRPLGGQTGDVLGAAPHLAEIAFLLGALATQTALEHGLGLSPGAPPRPRVAHSGGGGSTPDRRPVQTARAGSSTSRRIGNKTRRRRRRRAVICCIACPGRSD